MITSGELAKTLAHQIERIARKTNFSNTEDIRKRN